MLSALSIPLSEVRVDSYIFPDVRLRKLSRRCRIQACCDARYDSEREQLEGSGRQNTDATNDVHTVPVCYCPPFRNTQVDSRLGYAK